MNFFAGVDVGSLWAKAVIVDQAGLPQSRALLSTGLDLSGAGNDVLAAACAAAGLTRSALTAITGTGYGRADVPGASQTRSEIRCLAKGAFALLPQKMTVVDIGGQDSKLVFLDELGNRTDYRMNRRCAAGTGAFLELICLRLGLGLEQLNELAQSTDQSAPLSSFCSVFAATELLDLLRRGYSLPALARGAYRSVAQRIAELGVRGPLLALSGGVAAHHPMLTWAVQEATGLTVTVLPQPQHVGALGAALLARAEALKG